MDHLYKRLDGTYPHKWRSAFPDQNAVDNWMVTWAEAFEESGITPANIKDGLKTCQKKYEWPPSLCEFVRACLPSLDFTVAYYEALEGCRARSKGELGEWSHPAIYWASRPLSFDLMNQSYSQIKVRWEIALQEQLVKTEWDAIPKPMAQLVAPGKNLSSKEEASKRIKELAAGDITKSRNWNDDGFRWARKIMQRHEKKDRSIPSIALKNAREVLGS